MVCLDAGGNNLLGVQSCVDKNLGSLCVKYCASNGTSCLACIMPFIVLAISPDIFGHNLFSYVHDASISINST